VTATRVIFVRHGEPEPESRGICYGRLDVALSSRGIADSEALAATLAPVPLAAVYTSPRRRARATAEELCAGRSLAPTPDERLCELDFGTFEGRSYRELEREEPEIFRRWMAQPTAVTFAGGESYGDLRARVAEAVVAVRRAHEGDTVAVVTHGGVIRAAFAEAMSLPDERIFALDIGYCRVGVIDWFDSDAVVRVLNGSGGDLPLVLGGR
jgi:alpha-ribazole phosphatase